jgi:hypothetical protein
MSAIFRAWSSHHECYGIVFEDLSQEILELGMQVRFEGRGNSMRPFIEGGDIIIIEPINGSQLHIGDVVYYRQSDGLLCAHRLIHKDTVEGRAILTTKGDNLPYCDLPFSIDTVLGRVVQIESRGKQVSLNGGWCQMLGRLVAWFSRHSCSPTRTRLTRHLGRFYWFLTLFQRF